jgi:predicted amidophosphoribosyltransferase
VFSETFKSLLRGLSTLAFEEVCIGCASSPEFLCSNCGENFSFKPQRVTGEAFPIFSKVPYDEVAAKVVLSAKESALASAKALLVDALTETTSEFLKCFNIMDGRVELVPIPSSRRVRMRRGGDFMYELAKATQSRLTEVAPLLDIRVTKLLHVNKTIMDQSRLSEHERDLNLKGAFRADSNHQSTSYLLIVDDVITTGSTLREAYRALKERNMTVLGAVTACASQRRLLIR